LELKGQANHRGPKSPDWGRKGVGKKKKTCKGIGVSANKKKKALR